MQKKLLSLALALVMCLGLAVPVLAAESGEETDSKISFTFPDGISSSSVTYQHQLRSANAVSLKDTSTGEVMTQVISRESEPSEHSFEAVELPLGATITASGLRNDWSAGETDVVTITAFSDPDDDNVFDQWIYSFENNPPVYSFSEDGLSYAPEDTGKYGCQAFLTRDNALGNEVLTLPASVSVTTDYLNELFGPRTLIIVSVYTWKTISVEPLTAIPTEVTETAAYLLTGKKAFAAPDFPIPVPTLPPDVVPSVTVPEFTDVPAAQWYAAPVAWAVENSITNGATTTTFAPTDPCTQEQILTFLYRAQRNIGGAPAPASAEDMAAAINWAREQGMIDASFNGKELCTRSTAVSYIWQAMGKPEAAASSFSDVSAGASYASAVNWAVEIGVTDGTGDGKFSPSITCDRATIVTFLQRAYVPSARLK